jgi:hypothetical protein
MSDPRTVLQWSAELVVMNAIEEDLSPRQIADAVLKLAHGAEQHRITETGPTSSNTIWYAKCSCSTRFQASSVEAACNAQQAHLAALLYDLYSVDQSERRPGR